MTGPPGPGPKVGHDLADGPDLGRLVQQLWAAGELPDTVSVSRSNRPPPGYRVAQTYAVLPTYRTAQFLIPLGSPRLTRSALVSYNSLRLRRTRIARRVLGEAAGLRLLPSRAAGRLSVSIRTDVPSGTLGEVSLLDHLAAALDIDGLVMAPGVQQAAPNSKPNALLLSSEGVPLGLLKVGWNTATRHMVVNEGQALARFASSRLHQLHIPPVLYEGSWRDRALLVTAPLPADVRPRRGGASPPASTLRRLAEVGGVRRQRLGASTYWKNLVAKVYETEPVTAPVGLHQPLMQALDAVRRNADVELDFGTWHGDWVPWNMADHGNQVAVWDWEHSSDDAPVGFDAVHFAFQVAFVLDGRAWATAADVAGARSRAVLSDLDVALPSARFVTLYLVEHIVRAARTARGGGGWNRRLLATAHRALTSRR